MLALPETVLVPTPMYFSEKNSGPSASAPAPNRLQTDPPPSGGDVADLRQRLEQLEVWTSALRENNPSIPSIDQAWHDHKGFTVPDKKSAWGEGRAKKRR
jgi:hypothetical protein